MKKWIELLVWDARFFCAAWRAWKRERRLHIESRSRLIELLRAAQMLEDL